MQKVLVANRGEIAIRIIRALRSLGIPSVAIYSDADRAETHVRLADEAVRIGPPPPLESYLSIPAVIGAARETGADGIHPGYGFLSENAAFAQAVVDAGITWIGPPAEAIRLMGDKVAARGRMSGASVPVIPGTLEPITDVDVAVTAAEEVGFPIMLKAVGGGGGKGIRIVREAGALPEAFARASAEAGSAFDNPAMYVERLLENPRHVEVQVLADAHGNTIHIGERECSIQRRHQKLVEECPSPRLSEERRAEMGQAAVNAARAIDYLNAGTVEFLIDESGEFYFLEMNTRLQVEHPVTEAVYRVDIVQEQIRIAGGEPMTLHQEDLRPDGHAIEVRIYAESPRDGFLPSAGRIDHLVLPGGPGVRLDASLYDGQEVSLHYDPILGKLITWGSDRPQAIARLRQALSEMRIGGIRTSLSYLLGLTEEPDFVNGVYDTGTLERRTDSLLEKETGVDQDTAALAAALLAHARRGRQRPAAGPEGPAGGLSPWVLAHRRSQLGG
jgi:acetyl-CoA carboxylase biotin carboxylase subunit